MNVSTLRILLALCVCALSAFGAPPASVTPVPLINTVVGASANLLSPYGVAVDASGNIYIGDTSHSSVKRYNPSTGVTTTLAGSGTPGSTGDGGPAASALLFQPEDVRLDAAGNVYIADTFNSKVRVINMQSSTITLFGVSIPPGDIQTVASTDSCAPSAAIALDGNGNLFIACNGLHIIQRITPAGSLTILAGQSASQGFSGDTGSASSATLRFPNGVAVDAAGNVYINDRAGNGKIPGGQQPIHGYYSVRRHDSARRHRYDRERGARWRSGSGLGKELLPWNENRRGSCLFRQRGYRSSQHFCGDSRYHG